MDTEIIIKTCSHCNCEKPIADMYTGKKCKDCYNKYHREHYSKTRVVKNPYGKRDDKQKVTTKVTSPKVKYKLINPEYYLTYSVFDDSFTYNLLKTGTDLSFLEQIEEHWSSNSDVFVSFDDRDGNRNVRKVAEKRENVVTVIDLNGVLSKKPLLTKYNVEYLNGDCDVMYSFEFRDRFGVEPNSVMRELTKDCELVWKYCIRKVSRK